MTKRLRHVKSVVQHVFIIDDGEALQEVTADPVTVPSAHWADYVERGFAASVVELEATLLKP